MWLDTLRGEFDSALTTHREHKNLGSVKYLELLQALLALYRQGYDRYAKQVAAPVEQRLSWLQLVGAGLAQLENLFGRLSVPVAPALTPLVAAFSRLLARLVPGCSPIFRPVRDFNYELEEFHSNDFADLLTATTDHQWPMIFITLPTGLLDTPRAHVLVAHELGHAVAAFDRELVARNEAERDAAITANTAPPSPLTPLLPQPRPPRAAVLRIAKERWNEHNLPAPQTAGSSTPTAESAIMLEIVAGVGAEFEDWTQAWLEELFSDSVGTCLFGPAFFVSILEVLLTTDSLDRGTRNHPALAARLQCIGRTLQRPELGFKVESFTPKLKSRFEMAMAAADNALKINRTPSGSDAMLEDIVHGAVLARMDEVISTAIRHVGACKVLYTAAQFDADIAKYVQEFYLTGVPPIEKDLPLASVFNVGQVLCSDYMELFCPGSDDRDKERRVDDLLLKAIELNEIATIWGEA